MKPIISERQLNHELQYSGIFNPEIINIKSDILGCVFYKVKIKDAELQKLAKQNIEHKFFNVKVEYVTSS